MKYSPLAVLNEDAPRFERQKGVVIDALQISSRRLSEDFVTLARTDHGVIPWSDSGLSFTPFNPLTGDFYKGVHALSISSAVLRASSNVASDPAKSSPMFLLAKDVDLLGREVSPVVTNRGDPVSSLIVQADLTKIERSEEELSDLLSRIKPEVLIQVQDVAGESFPADMQTVDYVETLDSLVEASEALGVKTFFLAESDMPCGYYPASNSLVLDYHGFEAMRDNGKLRTICDYTMALSFASRSAVKGLPPLEEFSRYGKTAAFGKSSRPELYTKEGRIELLKAHYLASHLFLHFGIYDPSKIPVNREMARAWADDVESAADPAFFHFMINDFNTGFEVTGENLGGYLKDRGVERAQVVSQISKRTSKTLREQIDFRQENRSSVSIKTFDIDHEPLDKLSNFEGKSTFDL